MKRFDYITTSNIHGVIDANTTTEAVIKINQEIKSITERPTTIVKNLMSGKPVLLDANMVGGCCDPSTERYWCM